MLLKVLNDLCRVGIMLEASLHRKFVEINFIFMSLISQEYVMPAWAG